MYETTPSVQNSHPELRKVTKEKPLRRGSGTRRRCSGSQSSLIPTDKTEDEIQGSWALLRTYNGHVWEPFITPMQNELNITKTYYIVINVIIE